MYPSIYNLTAVALCFNPFLVYLALQKVHLMPLWFKSVITISFILGFIDINFRTAYFGILLLLFPASMAYNNSLRHKIGLVASILLYSALYVYGSVHYGN